MSQSQYSKIGSLATSLTSGGWTDTEIKKAADDNFGFQDYAEVLARRATQTDTPLTIGVYGRWGSGKTSLMRLIEARVQRGSSSGDQVKTLWINVWKLSNQEQLWNAFLQALLTQVHESLGWYRRLKFDWSLFKERIRWRMLGQTLLVNSYRILITITPILLTVLSDKPGANGGELLAFTLNPITGGGASLILALWLLVRPAVEAAKEKVSLDLGTVLKDAPYEAQVSALQQLEKQFERMVKAWVNAEGRLVVFIDDLDRCTPDKAPEVLEAVKLFATTPGCIYIIGLDHDIVRQGIKTKYKFETEAAAREYLEKIVQIPFHLPPLDEGRIESFIREYYPDLRHFCPTAPDVFAAGLEPNPRQIKRALNIYRTLLDLADVRVKAWEMEPVEPELVAKMVVIESRFRALHQYLVRRPELLLQVETKELLRKQRVRLQEFKKQQSGRLGLKISTRIEEIKAELERRSESNAIENLIAQHNIRLQTLKEQQAVQGIDTPPDILIEIEDIEAEIEKLQAELTDIGGGIESIEPEPEELSTSDVIKKRIEQYATRLQVLKEQQALRGIETPPGVLIEIEDIEAELEKLQAELVRKRDAESIESEPEKPSKGAALKELIKRYNTRLQKLKEQQALRGLDTPPNILVEIEDIEAELEKLQAELIEVESIESEPEKPSKNASGKNLIKQDNTRLQALKEQQPYQFGPKISTRMEEIEAEIKKPSESNAIQELIKRDNIRLQELKEQQALRGIDTPPHILIEIEDKEAEIERLQAELIEIEEIEAEIEKLETESEDDEVTRSILIGKPETDTSKAEPGLISETDLTVLENMLCTGDKYFKDHRDQISSYIYLIATTEGATEQERPSRRERGALLGDDPAQIKAMVDEIMKRGDEQTRQLVVQAYTERLEEVLSDFNRYTVTERVSANLALDLLERIEQQDFEPKTIRVFGGPFLMGSSDEDKEADSGERPQHTLEL